MYVYFFIKCVVRWSENSVRFEKFYGNWLPDGLNSVRFYLTVLDFISQCEIWHVRYLDIEKKDSRILKQNF